MWKPEPFAALRTHSDDAAVTDRPEPAADPRPMGSNKWRRRIVYVPQPTPLERFSVKRLSVTQLCEQRSCEVMLVNRLKEQQRKHGAKDLDDASSFDAQTSSEDLEALKLLSVVKKMAALEAGQSVRDFPLFGVMEGVFLTGRIDRLHFNRQRELVMSETKTLDKDVQLFVADTREHEFQVGLHKLLFESMTGGQVKGDQYMEHLHLQPEQTLGPEVRGLAEALGCPSDTLRELTEHLLAAVASARIKRVDKLQVIYVVKSKSVPSSSRGTMPIRSEERRLRDELRGYLAYWRGQREPRGVDIEDAWKCGLCPYEDGCEWKNNELVEDRMKLRVRLNSVTEPVLRPRSPTADADAYVCDIFNRSQGHSQHF